MKYKDEEIGIPCPEMVQEFIDEAGLSISAEEVLEYWKKKNFLTKKGQPIKTLEALVHVANSIYVQRMRKLGKPNEKRSKASKWIDNHAKFFCECMNNLKKENPRNGRKSITSA